MAFFCFSSRSPLLRGFDAVINGIAQDMHQRIDKFIQNVVVNHGIGANDIQYHLLVEQTSGLAHTALQA